MMRRVVSLDDTGGFSRVSTNSPAKCLKSRWIIDSLGVRPYKPFYVPFARSGGPHGGAARTARLADRPHRDPLVRDPDGERDGPRALARAARGGPPRDRSGEPAQVLRAGPPRRAHRRAPLLRALQPRLLRPVPR